MPQPPTAAGTESRASALTAQVRPVRVRSPGQLEFDRRAASLAGLGYDLLRPELSGGRRAGHSGPTVTDHHHVAMMIINDSDPSDRPGVTVAVTCHWQPELHQSRSCRPARHRDCDRRAPARETGRYTKFSCKPVIAAA